jgi:nicotinate-nucleotide pyrophosphorylase (carboxylating)
MNTNQQKETIDHIIEQALLEDLQQTGDITSEAIFSDQDTARAVIKSKSSGILSGAYLINPIFSRINRQIEIDLLAKDGGQLNKGTVICTLSGPVKAILAGERIALNFLQRLSGIATLTNQYVQAIKHTGARLLDTRKTTPNLRILEKKAVLHGGGCNHRFGLFDMILIKDTHVKRSGGVGNALEKALFYRGNNKDLKIEVEVQSVPEFEEALSFLPDRIMLDNMSIADMQKCVSLIKERNVPVETEASGNITLATIESVAKTGVDFISSGALTHSAAALDIHLVID